MNESTVTVGAMKRHNGLTIAIGILLGILGVIAIASPYIAGISVTVVVGVLLLAAGLAMLVYGFRTGHGILGIIAAIAGAGAGAFLILQPLAGLATLTLMLSAYFFVSGIASIIGGFMSRHESGWVWLLISGVVSLILAWMIFAQFPLSGAWAIGILVGVQLIMSGIAMVAISMAT